ncbi:hypothetical protein [Manganibacter manganicus]|uniref:Anti-sigma factor NepR domain-containing protein n=1 Tax=Manganibacter manganicus TaxID=1873176 RepID=A0A1V8RSK5_9HYPH|nr:hypothetical protein [Pseudaminobacter manganicus]OQM76157.1 hypothetical protein BFN67_15960 [Pseudaminobacter manganicus]
MAGSSANKHDRLSAEIRRQFGDEATSRFVQTLPTFKVVADIPEHMRTLLKKLQYAEETSDCNGR